jgi:hypothetical protein
VTPAQLERLAEKYRRMAELRRTLPSEITDEDRARLRQIAAAWPGALRELDTLPTDEIDRRALALERAAAGAPVEPWMAWMHGYHALMRAALAIKRQPGEAAALAAAHGVDAEFARAVAQPRHGRLMVTVFERLAVEHGVDRGAIWDALFPPRRGPRDYRRR